MANFFYSIFYENLALVRFLNIPKNLESQLYYYLTINSDHNYL